MCHVVVVIDAMRLNIVLIAIFLNVYDININININNSVLLPCLLNPISIAN